MEEVVKNKSGKVLKTIQVNFRVDAIVFNKIKEICAKSGTKQSDFIRYAVARFLISMREHK